MPRKATEKQKIQMQAYRMTHLKAIAIQRRSKYAANPRPAKARASKYYQEHREEILARKSWQTSERKAYNKAWRAVHPRAYGERDALYCARRYARKRGLLDTLRLEQWQAIKAAYKYCCAYCGKKTKLEQDHIIPLTKGGGTTPDNIIPSCRSCNSRKHTSLPSIPVKVLMF